MIREIIDQFNKLQELDTRIYSIEKTLARIPEMLHESRMRYESVDQERATATQSCEIQKSELLKATVNYEEQKDLLASAQKKLTSVQNNKEYEAALKELDSLKKQIYESETKIAEFTHSLNDLENIITIKTEEFKVTGDAYATEKAEKEEENKSLFDELEALKKERESFISVIKKSNLSKYERIRAARHNLAIVPINNEVCTGCSMKIPPQLAVEVKKENELLQCPYCQRFLYHHKNEVTAEAS